MGIAPSRARAAFSNGRTAPCGFFRGTASKVGPVPRREGRSLCFTSYWSGVSRLRKEEGKASPHKLGRARKFTHWVSVSIEAWKASVRFATAFYFFNKILKPVGLPSFWVVLTGRNSIWTKTECYSFSYNDQTILGIGLSRYIYIII